MNIYSKKQKIKLSLFFAALIIGITTIWYSNYLVKKLSAEERKKVELWAETVIEIKETKINADINRILSKILQENKTIPVIVTDENNNVIDYINLNPVKSKNKKYLVEQIEIMKTENAPIIIDLNDKEKNIVYYKETVLLTNLFYYPFIQIGLVFLFVTVSYLAFNSSRRAEENQVWVGMSKETAHQLGTPISSLLAWVELLKIKNTDKNFVLEVEKDVKRLETITERFSKIGSSPDLSDADIVATLEKSIFYLKTRISRNVLLVLNFNKSSVINVPLNVALFEWVIENLYKNAVDAVNGKGTITAELINKEKQVIIDISDTGKGIAKSNHKTIFKPGFTTKKRGWGLGLSLAKRIIESYHSGKIFIKQSELNKGTTFRIILQKEQQKT
jgi:nitrogen-specific signal transduction histidine kinase